MSVSSVTAVLSEANSHAETYVVIVAQQLVQEINSLVGDEALVLGVNEAVPGFPLEAAENVIVLSVQLDLVLIKVVEQLVRAEDLSNLD